jgi:glyoxylase-like metal-dependent hydrolase (beta-lactamase superfamily II)/8-oxo-dGTP pyrophosphatase MutT (NUDIX family)
MQTSIRPAATVVLLRDGANGLEALMLRRVKTSKFMPGAYVFPGGALEPGDAAPEVLERLSGIDAEYANRRLEIASGALAYWVAAIRECFEEAGVLLAHDDDGAILTPARVSALSAKRAALCRGELEFPAFLAEERLRLAARDIAYVDHWVTPPLRPRRFDTRFFLARAPSGQEASHDQTEMDNSLWLRPQDALARAAELELPVPTRAVLMGIASIGSVQRALDETRAKPRIVSNRPAVAKGSEGTKLFFSRDAPYAEIRWSDPEETTETTYDMVPGIAKRLDSRVTRIIAPNPGMMTGPGTNTYLVGDDELAVIDPGPAIDAHIDAIVAEAHGRVRWILCTHTHMDHSPAAAKLKAKTGATVIGMPAPDTPRQDAEFAPDVIARHGEALRLGKVTFVPLHTPGHASNHVCYLLDETKMLFTGDHVMQGSTVIINPPDGDMRAYLRSLEAILSVDTKIIAPGHGYLIGAPHEEVRRLITHRLGREAKVLSALGALGEADLAGLVVRAYDDVPAERHPAAMRSLLAHLLKLVAEGRVSESAGGYRRAAGP